MRATTAPMRRTSARRAFYCCTPALVLFALGGTAARAEILENVSIQNTFSYVVGSTSVPAVQIGGATETHYQGQALPGVQSEAGLNYTATADSSGFFFLHDNYCVGRCATTSQTIITFSLFNNSDSGVDLRFDSQITPGHMARIAGNAGMDGSFNFAVTQSFDGPAATTLYNATGSINSDGIFLDTGGLDFNGLNRQTDPNFRWRTVDWSTTNLSVPLLHIAGFSSTQVSYIATYQTFADAACTDVTNCQGLQVVFGDPRNNGGVTELMNGADAAPNDPIYPVIGRDYDPTHITANFVAVGSPLPGDIPTRPPVNYGPLFNPRVLGVPEPATWAMMIGGFGMIGGAMRRRRPAREAASLTARRA